MESGLCSEENRFIFTLLPSSFVFGNWLPALQHAVWGTRFSAARARKTRQMFRGSGKANTSLLFIVNASNFRFSVDANCRHPTQSLAFIYTKSLFPAKTAERKLWWNEWKVFTILPRATGDDSRPAISESSLRDSQQCLKIKRVKHTDRTLSIMPICSTIVIFLGITRLQWRDERGNAKGVGQVIGNEK